MTARHFDTAWLQMNRERIETIEELGNALINQAIVFGAARSHTIHRTLKSVTLTADRNAEGKLYLAYVVRTDEGAERASGIRWYMDGAPAWAVAIEIVWQIG